MPDKIKEVCSTKGAYICMTINKDGGGEFNLDDRIGWRWDGDDEEFLLGLLRVGNSKVADEFDEELEQSNITKNDIKRAIRHSLNKNPKDGLYNLIGDNNAYMDFEDRGGGEYSDQSYEIESCLKRNFYEDKIADRVADEITEKSMEDIPSTKEIFEEYEDFLADNFKHGKSWKQYIEQGIRRCNTHESAKDFMICLFEHMEEEKESVQGGYDENYREAIYEKMGISDKDLKEIAEKNNIPLKLLDHCSHGGWNVLEEFRPIKEGQSFLESFGANI